jgi:hypothetical protein
MDAAIILIAPQLQERALFHTVPILIHPQPSPDNLPITQIKTHMGQDICTILQTPPCNIQRRSFQPRAELLTTRAALGTTAHANDISNKKDNHFGQRKITR